MAKKTKINYTPRIPIKMTASVAQVSEVQVRKVRANKRDGPAAKRVKQAEALRTTGMNLLLDEVKRIMSESSFGYAQDDTAGVEDWED